MLAVSKVSEVATSTIGNSIVGMVALYMWHFQHNELYYATESGGLQWDKLNTFAPKDDYSVSLFGQDIPTQMKGVAGLSFAMAVYSFTRVQSLKPTVEQRLQASRMSLLIGCFATYAVVNLCSGGFYRYKAMTDPSYASTEGTSSSGYLAGLVKRSIKTISGEIVGRSWGYLSLDRFVQCDTVKSVVEGVPGMGTFAMTRIPYLYYAPIGYIYQNMRLLDAVYNEIVPPSQNPSLYPFTVWRSYFEYHEYNTRSRKSGQGSGQASSP